MKTFIILILPVCMMAYLSCSSQKKDYVYKFQSSKKITAPELKESKHKIDAGKTYEIFFTIEKDVQCLRAAVTSATLQDRFTHKSKPIKTFFIIERMIDISGYSGSKEGFEYTEIDRNFDSSWDRKQNITICSSDTDPLKKINSTSVYRIRFCNYLSDESNFNIRINADTKITILTELPKNKD